MRSVYAAEIWFIVEYLWFFAEFIRISAICQSSGVSRSMLLWRGIGEGIILLNDDKGPLRRESTVIT